MSKNQNLTMCIEHQKLFKSSDLVIPLLGIYTKEIKWKREKMYCYRCYNCAISNGQEIQTA